MDRFDKAWASVCDCPPIAHELKHQIPERWVRFYGLPEGKRYADSPDEGAERVARAESLFAEMLADGTDVFLATGYFAPLDAQPRLTDDQRLLHTSAQRWRVETLPDEEDWPLHLWISEERLEPQLLRDVISMTAEVRVIGALLFHPTLRIAMHPYDGGIDVFLPSTTARDALGAKFTDWRSPLPSGL